MTYHLPEFPLQGVNRLLGMLPSQLKSPIQALASYAGTAFISLQQALKSVDALQAENQALREEVAELKAPTHTRPPIAITTSVWHLADLGAGEAGLRQRRALSAVAVEGIPEEAAYTETYVRHILNSLRATDAAMGEMERRLTIEIGRLEDLLENERSLLALADQDFERLTELLRATALALKGAPVPGTSHSWDDLPVVARLTRLAAKRALR